MDWFATEEACLDYVERLRWPDGFICPACGIHAEPYRASRQRLMCRSCQHQTSVTTDTIFQKTRTPLRVWLAGAWYVRTRNSVSARWACNACSAWAATRWPGPCCTAFVGPWSGPSARNCMAWLRSMRPIWPSRTGSHRSPQSGERARPPRSWWHRGRDARPRGLGRIRLRRVKDDSAASVICSCRKWSIQPAWSVPMARRPTWV